MDLSNLSDHRKSGQLRESIQNENVHQRVRSKPSGEKRLCSFCSRQFSTQEFMTHSSICADKQGSTTDEPVSVASKKNSTCQEVLDGFASKRDISDESDEGFATPRAQTPTQV